MICFNPRLHQICPQNGDRLGSCHTIENLLLGNPSRAQTGDGEHVLVRFLVFVGINSAVPLEPEINLRFLFFVILAFIFDIKKFAI